MYRVFVSYSTRDVDWASYLKQLLSDAKASVFVAEHDVSAGSSLSSEIAAQVKQCDLFLLLWSPRSQASAYVQSEVFLAKAEGKRILPILLQEGIQLPPILGDLKYLPLPRDPQVALAWLKEHVATAASQKATSDLVGLALMAFIGWALLKSGK
jgi:hypothetical protein